MNALIKRSALLGTVFMFFLFLSQAVAAQTNVSATMTVDNEFDLYVSTLADNSDGVLVGSGLDWTITDQLASALTPGVTNYINIVARNTAPGPAMFLGEFSLDAVDFAFANGTQTLLTNTTDWTVSEVGFGGAIVATVGQGANGAAPWGNFPLIDATAVFIWGTNLATTPVYISAVINPVVTDLELTLTESIDPVVAGSGADNLTYVFTATNNGPDDATGTVTVVTNFTRPPGVNITGFVESQGTLVVDDWIIGPIANGVSETLTVFYTVDTTAQEGTDVITIDAALSGNETDPNPLDNIASIATSIIREATFDITKIWDGGEVDVTLTCSDGAVISTTTSGLTAQLIHSGFADGVDCVVTETVPAGFAPSYSADCDVTDILSGSVYSCAITNATTTARFQVTKDFSDGSTDDVDVTLTCNTGLPLEQSLTIAGGDPIGVIFVVTEYIDGTMSCAVTEVTNTPGYDMDTSGCVWDNVMTSDSPFACVVNNTARDGTFTVNKDWNIFNEDTGSEVFEQAHVEIWCDAEITNGGSYDEISENWYLSGYLGDGESLTATVSTLTGTANCWANEQILDSGVESSDDCGSRPIVAGGSSSCTFINTVFFEGIPTLSQYGLALMALLMLGVGMVGFRRFA